jgi:K+-sensing histidine kinase KdpD
MAQETSTVKEEVGSTNNDHMSIALRALLPYAVALLSVTVAVALADTLTVRFGRPSLHLFFVAVLLSAWYGGVWPGLAATALASLSAVYFIFPPIGSFAIERPEDQIRFGIFVASLLVVVFFTATRKYALETVQHLNEALRHENSQRSEREAELSTALARIKTLCGLLPICSMCKKIRDDKGYWHLVEEYVRQHSEAEFTHSICPDCINKHF